MGVMMAGLTQCRPVLAHDDLHGGDDLLGHRRRHGGGVQGAVRVAAQVVDQLLPEELTQNYYNLEQSSIIWRQFTL